MRIPPRRVREVEIYRIKLCRPNSSGHRGVDCRNRMLVDELGDVASHKHDRKLVKRSIWPSSLIPLHEGTSWTSIRFLAKMIEDRVLN